MKKRYDLNLFAAILLLTGLRPVPLQAASVKDFGAKGDAIELADGKMSAGSHTLESARAPFVKSDVGKIVFVMDSCSNAGVVSTLEGTIEKFNTARSVEIAIDTSSTSARGIACSILPGVSNAKWVFGTDDTQSINTAIAAAGATAARTLKQIELEFPSNNGAGYLVRPSDRRVDPKGLGSLIVNVSNVTFSGDSTWIYNSGAWSVQAGRAVRGSVWVVGVDRAAHSHLMWRGLNHDGLTSGNTDMAQLWPANKSTGDGWDITNKGIEIFPDITSDDVVIDHCTFQNLKGELVYQGGSHGNRLTVQNSILQNSNADAISSSHIRQIIVNNHMLNLANACIENGLPANTVSYMVTGNFCSGGARGGFVFVSVSNSPGIAQILIENDTIERSGLTRKNGSGALGGITFTLQTTAKGAIGGATVRNNTLRDNKTGISITALTDSKIEGNECILDTTADAAYCITLVGTQSANGYLHNVTVSGNTLHRTQNATAKGYKIYPLNVLSTTPVRFTNVQVLKNSWIDPGGGNRVNLDKGAAASWANIAQEAVLFKGNTCENCAFDRLSNLQPLTASLNTIYPFTDEVRISPNAAFPVTILANSKLPNGTEIEVVNGTPNTVTFTSDQNMTVPGIISLSQNQKVIFTYDFSSAKWVFVPKAPSAPDSVTIGAR